jgi:hypothetical protein
VIRSSDPKSSKKWLLVALTLLFVVGGAALGVKFAKMREQAELKSAPASLFSVNGGTVFRALALPAGDSILTMAENGATQVVYLDKSGKPGWKDVLNPAPTGARDSARGYLVYSAAYVRYYEAKGLVWQWRPDGPVLSGYPTNDGGALIICDSGPNEYDARIGPFHERIVQIDPKGKKGWEKSYSDRALVWAGSSLDGENLALLLVAQGAGSELSLMSLKRTGQVTGEVRSAGGLTTTAALSSSGETSIVALDGKIAAMGPLGRWTYEVSGQVIAGGLTQKREVVVLVKPVAKYELLERVGGYHVICLNESGIALWERRVAFGSYNLFLNPQGGTMVLATPEGLDAYDANGKALWTMKLPAPARSLSFHQDGSFLVVAGQGNLTRYSR